MAESKGVRVGLVKIPVTDLGRAATFYREVLGLPEEFAVPAYGWAQYSTEGVPLCLYISGRGGTVTTCVVVSQPQSLQAIKVTVYVPD